MNLSGGIEMLLGWINAAVATIGQDPLLTASLSEAIPSVYSLVMTVSSVVIRPIGWTILSVVFLIEMYKILTRDGGFSQGSKVMEYVLFTIVNMMVLKVVIDAAPILLKLFFDTGTWIASGIADSSGIGSSGLAVDTDQVTKAIGSDIGTQLVCMILLFIVFLIATITGYAAKGILLGRFIQLYIYLAFSPLPLATLPSAELRNRAINFLMSFFALSIQGAVLMMIMAMFPYIVGEAMTNYDWSADWVGGLVLFTFYSVVLFAAVFSSNRISKEILGGA